MNADKIEEKTCSLNYEAEYDRLLEANRKLEDENKTLWMKYYRFQGAIAMAELIFGDKWNPKAVEASKG